MKTKEHLIGFILMSGLCLASYSYLDKSIAQYCAFVDPRIIYIFEIITQLGSSKAYLIMSLISFILFRFVRKNMAIAYRSLFIFIAVAISGLLTDLLKYGFARYRPVLLLQSNLYGFDFFQYQYEMTSFPSGHANTITALMLAVYFMYPRYPLVFALIALLVIASRVILCAHFLSDVLFGGYLAMVTTACLKDCFARRNIDIFAV
jgi:membrane-associated phospholipid phosphatase